MYQISRGGAAAARVAHNHKVAGSSPAPATKRFFEDASASFCLHTWSNFGLLAGLAAIYRW